MAIHRFAAVDLGATSGRVILATVGDGKISLEEILRFSDPIIEMQGHFYWDLPAIYKSVIDGLGAIAARGEKIESIGIDTWGVDFAMFGRDGAMLRLPYCYRDPHTEGAPEKFFERMPCRTLYEKTGIQIMNFNSVFQFDTLRRNGCSALEAADKILFIPDALAYLLTGNAVTEYTIASTAQMIDPRTKLWDADILSELGLAPEKFGRMVMPGDAIGTLTAEVQRLTGLGAVPVVAVASHDTGSAVAAVPAENDDFAYLSSGTWSLMGIESKEPIIDERSFAMNFTNEGGVEGTTRLLKNITGMWILEQCLRKWKDEGRDYTYPEIVKMATGAAPFRTMIDPDDASFAAPGDMPAAIRAYCERTGQPAPGDDSAMIRAIFESLALKYRFVLDRFRSLAPFEIERLHVIGGGSKNALLNQFTADSLGIPVTAGPSEATAVGNIMLQARAAGCVGTLQEMRTLIARCIPVEEFTPGDTAAWDAAYTRFMTIVK